MRRTSVRLALLGTLAIFTACTNGQFNHQPGGITKQPLSKNSLQFAVGNATFPDATTGLNTVVTWRQPSGLAGTLADTPTILGPTGFVVPSVAAAGNDAGTNTISGTEQTGTGTPPTTTFGTSGGAFEYGFAPANSDQSGAAFYPQLGGPDGDAIGGPNFGFANTYVEPMYLSSGNALPYLGGPPAYPFFNTGTFPGGFLGYTAGFTAFYGAAAVAGSYQLTLNVFSSTSPTFTTQATGTLSSKAALPLFATPTFTEDTKGGGTASVTVPAGCTEALVYIVDLNGNTNTAKSNPVVFYTVEVTGSGTQTATLPDSLGPAPGTLGPQPSLNAGDPYLVYAVGFDYPAFEAGPPANTSAAPPITGSNGQADLTMSGFAAGTYGSGITGGGLSRTHFVLPGRRLP